ncbi:Gfo/Idh/MocA family oxidoreductase, partial [Candidatus Omnitrophota bacterium]
MHKLKVGVVGVGSLGSIHARIFAGLSDVELVAVADVEAKRAKSIARACRCRYFTDYRQLFDLVEAASIVAPTQLHYPLAKDFLEHNTHLLVEKPFTNTVGEAERLLKLAKDKNLVLQVGHVERFNAAVQAVQQLPGSPNFIEC